MNKQEERKLIKKHIRNEKIKKIVTYSVIPLMLVVISLQVANTVKMDRIVEIQKEVIETQERVENMVRHRNEVDVGVTEELNDVNRHIMEVEYRFRDDINFLWETFGERYAPTIKEDY